MMGYRDPNDNEFEAEYWDDFIYDFGIEEYIRERYEQGKGFKAEKIA